VIDGMAGLLSSYWCRPPAPPKITARIYFAWTEPPLRETVPNLYVYADERTFRQRAARI
jgi:hypothetical protein